MILKTYNYLISLLDFNYIEDHLRKPLNQVPIISDIINSFRYFRLEAENVKYLISNKVLANKMNLYRNALSNYLDKRAEYTSMITGPIDKYGFTPEIKRENNELYLERVGELDILANEAYYKFQNLIKYAKDINIHKI